MTGADGVSMAKLRELAEAATPGEWWNDIAVTDNVSWGVFNGTRRVCLLDQEGFADTEFIAAAHPATVLWLLDRIEEAREIIKGQQTLLAHYRTGSFHRTPEKAIDAAGGARAWLASVEETP